MDYIIECRLSPKFVEGLSELARPLLDWPLFVYSFSSEEGPTGEQAAMLFEEALQEELQNLPPTLQIEYDRVQAGEGSVLIVIFLTAVASSPAAAPVVGSIGAGALLLWAADKFFGGALSELGKRVVGKFLSKFPGRQKDVPVLDLEEIARSRALAVAKERGCSLAILSGGVSTDGKYSWTYQLVGCDARFVSILVDGRNKEPPQVQVLV